jgi:hypothetical protein
MGCPGQADGTLPAKGSNEARDFGKAMATAEAALRADYLVQEAAWLKANKCPDGCTNIDYWTDPKPTIVPSPQSGVPQRLKSLNFELGYAVALTETIGIHRTCYETGTARDAAKGAREEAARKAEEAARKAAKDKG